MTTEIIILSIANVALCIAAILVLLWMFSRWERRCENRFAETSREVRSCLYDDKERGHTEAGGSERLDEFSRRLDDFHRYQDSMREFVEKALDQADRRWRKRLLGEDESDEANLALLKNRLPELEEILGDVADKCADIDGVLNGLFDKHKALDEKSAEADSPEKAVVLVEQTREVLDGISGSIADARKVFAAAGENICGFSELVSSMFKVCDLCGNTTQQLSICLNCNRKYCEECKGLQIGHCKACAPSYKSLHMDISEA